MLTLQAASELELSLYKEKQTLHMNLNLKHTKITNNLSYVSN